MPPPRVTIEETYRGDSAVEWNTAYSALTAAQRDEQMHDQARAYFDSFTVGSSSLQFDKAKRELRVTIKGTAKLNWKDGWSFIPNSTIGFDPDFDRPPGALHDAPLAINHPRYVKDEATIRLPAGFAAGQTPIQPVHQTLAGVEYARTETVNGDVLTVDSSERSVAPEVPYKDALAAATRLKSLYQDDVYLRMPATYGRTAADVAALGDQQPGSAKEFVQRGSQYLDAAKLENALSDFNKALEIEPKNGDALSGRALTYLWQGKYNLAQSDLTSAEAIKPPSAVLLRARGLFTEMRSQYSEAVDFYTRSLDQEPGNAFALMHRALSRSNLGQMDQAMADYNEAVQHLGNDPNTLISRAVFEAMLGRTKEATDDLAAASKTVTTPALVAARGWVAERSGDFKTALATYTELLRSNPGNAGYLVRRSESYRALGNRDQALADSDAALKAGYKGMDLRLLRANIFFQQGNRMAAAREAALATSEHPESDYAFVLAGKTYAALGMNAAAMQAFDRAIQLNPAAYVYVNRAQVRPYSDFAGQIADYDAALKLQPNMPEALTLKATALSKHGNYAEALALYDQMPKSAGNELWIVTQRAVLLAKAGRTADAAKEFAALRTKAKSPFDLNSLCWTEATAGVQLDDAVQECRDAVKSERSQPAICRQPRHGPAQGRQAGRGAGHLQ